ncbi:autotransporter domain-containing protein [Sphingosinicella rhizophila]|uniref:Autotransporter domain-containing protein n=1 Tax=Sphingosinicella rhizophila TaxID=3050082 RepID=A0ABU3QA25_9SPHN|nr:autotransporter domain-containing protein [Sphingosinicella sp. GR2756]MDT9600247.1 autotransporter domain-containing protein [Sphingosinicella sp. GR2756]
MAQSTCGDGSPGPVCQITNTGASGPIVGTAGTATIITNSGSITGSPAIGQGQSVALYIDNQENGTIEGAVEGNSLFLFGVRNAGEINGSVVVNDTSPNVFTGKAIYYIADGGTVDGAVQLGTTGYTTANFIQRGVDDGVSGSITAGSGLDIYTKSYAATQSVELGQYSLPATFELEGYEILGETNTLTLTGTGETIVLMGDGHVVNEAEINLVDTTNVYPVEVVPAAVSTYNMQFATYQRQNPPQGQPGLYAIPVGNELASFTNDGVINGDVRVATASFTNNGEVNLLSHAPGTVIRSAADQDFLFRNNGSIVMTDNGARLAQAAIEDEFEGGTFGAVRLTTAVDATGLNGVVIENGENGLISGGLHFAGVASDFTFTNDGEIEIGDNPFEIDRAVAIDLGNFEVAQNPALREDAVADSVTITNNGTLDGGIEAEVTTRTLSFTNNGHINADVTDAQAAAVELATDDWADTPGGADVNDAESVTFLNSASGTIDGSVELEAKASFVSITNDGSITQALRSDHGVTVGANAEGNLAEALSVRQETALGADLVFSNTGTINNADYAGGAVHLELEAGDISSGLPGAADADASVTVNNSGSITASGGNYLTFPPAVGLTQGQVGIDFSTALVVAAEAEGTSTVTINNQQGGLIDARGTAHMWTGSVQVVPDQQPNSGGIAIAVADAAAVTIVNDGTIRGGPGGPLVLPNGNTLVPINAEADFEGVWGGAIDTFGAGADNVTNSSTGVIEGGVALRSGDDRFENYGTMDGNLYLGEGDDTFVQAWDATFTGTADGGSGTDTFVLDLDGSTANDTVDLAIYDQLVSFEILQTQGTGGGVTGGSGDDNVNNTGTLNGPVDLGEGDNQFTNASGGTINNNVTAGSGDDAVGNQGTINGAVDLGEGDNQFANAGGATINGNVQTGTGSDAVDNQGTINGSVDLGDGDNQFANASGGTIAGDVATGTGNDAVDNQGTIDGSVDLGDGDNEFANASGGTIAGDVETGTGNDAVDNQGTIDGSVDLGDGDNQFANASGGAIAGDVQTGAGNDAIDNQGMVEGDIVLDGESAAPPVQTFSLQAASSAAAVVPAPTGGDDVLANDGNVIGSIYAGGGNDVLTNSGSVGGNVDLGDGDDRLILEGDWTIGGGVSGGDGVDAVQVTFADAASETNLPVLDLSGFTGIEQFQVDGGTGKVGGEVTFDEITITSGRLIGAAASVITADVNVGNGGTFGSAGTVIGDIAIASGGGLSPGASPAVMRVVGDVSLAGGSTTTFEFVPAPGQSDQLLIDGDLAIAPGAVLNIEGNRPPAPGVAYDMIVADEIDGEFTIGTWDHAAVAGFLRYVDGPTEDRLQLLGTFLAADDASPQTALGIGYVNALLISGEASNALLGSIPTLLDANGYASSAAFARIFPEPYAGASQLGVENGLSLARTIRSGIAVPTHSDPALFAFGSASGTWRALGSDRDTGTSRAKSRSFGVLGGLGYGSDSASIAAFVGHLDGRQRIAALDARTDADGLVGGVTGHVAAGGFDLNALIAYDWSDAKTMRAVPGANVTSSEYDLRSLTLDVSAAYAFALSEAWALQPGVGLTHISNRRGSASETGSTAFALDVEGRRTKATFVDGSFVLRGGQNEGATIRPFVQLGVRHQLAGDLVHATGSFVGMGTRFTVLGAPRKETMITAGAGFSAEIAPGIGLFAAYQGEFGGGGGTLVNAGFRIGF